MKNYNVHLSELRKKAKLSLKDAAKAIGINRWVLYFYENGYFKPTKKHLEKINNFYKVDLSLKGEDAYPAPTKEKALSGDKVRLKVKRIVFGSISGAILLSIAIGAILFNKSVNNTSSYYGASYNEMREKTIEKNNYGYDLVTALKYYVATDDEIPETNILFYETNNILYFNECNYSLTDLNDQWSDLDRYHYQFGFNLGVSSYTCEFNFGSVGAGTFFTCNFDYNGGPVDKIYNFKMLVEGSEAITEEKALQYANSHMGEVDVALSKLISKTLGREVDFYHDFLADREMGRKKNFSLQISALLLIFPGIIAFFIIFGIFVRSLIQNIRPRLVTTEPKDALNKKEDLPEDIHFNIGIPDFFIVLFAKVAQYGSMAFLVLAFIARLGVPFLSFLSHPDLLSFFKYSLLAGIFLEHFVMIGRIKTPTVLFREIIYNLGIFLFIATMESVVITLTNAWGYDFASLIYKYIPGNVYQVVAVHYLIFLFLFFQPPFLNKRKRIVRIIWHSLSFIPLGFLIATYFLSNNYALVYGVEENIFMSFWFPNGFLSLSIVCVLFLYATFAIRLYYERMRYGKHNSQIFFYGDRYTILENSICAGLIIIATLLDLIFMKNQYAYYLGLGNNLWMIALVPFILLCKYSPNSQQIFLVDEQFSGFARENKEE